MSPSPEYTALAALDKEVLMLSICLFGSSTIDPDTRITAAEAILMLQHDRKQMVKEIMTRMYGSTKP